MYRGSMEKLKGEIQVENLRDRTFGVTNRRETIDVVMLKSLLQQSVVSGRCCHSPGSQTDGTKQKDRRALSGGRSFLSRDAEKVPQMILLSEYYSIPIF